MSILRSNWWPVLALSVAFIWLVFINVGNLGPFGIYLNPPEEYYRFLEQLDSISHFMVAVAMASLFVQAMGRAKTLGVMLFLVFAWELWEILTQDYLAGEPVTQRVQYYSDLLDDIALGIAGLLVGAFFGDTKDSNTSVSL